MAGEMDGYASIGRALCPICGTGIRPTKVVCRSCYRATDGLSPGIYVEGTGGRLDSVSGMIELDESIISDWEEERDRRVQRRRVQRAAVTIRRVVADLEALVEESENALSRGYASYFDCLDALETFSREFELLENSIGSAKNAADARPVSRAKQRMSEELDTIFESLTRLSEALDGIDGREDLEEITVSQ